MPRRLGRRGLLYQLERLVCGQVAPRHPQARQSRHVLAGVQLRRCRERLQVSLHVCLLHCWHWAPPEHPPEHPAAPQSSFAQPALPRMPATTRRFGEDCADFTCDAAMQGPPYRRKAKSDACVQDECSRVRQARLPSSVHGPWSATSQACHLMSVPLTAGPLGCDDDLRLPPQLHLPRGWRSLHAGRAMWP